MAKWRQFLSFFFLASLQLRNVVRAPPHPAGCAARGWSAGGLYILLWFHQKPRSGNQKSVPVGSRIGESDRGRDREFLKKTLFDLLNENCLSSCLSERKAVEFNAAGEVEAGGARSAQTCSRSRSFEQRSSDRVKLTWVPVRRRVVLSLTCWPHRPAGRRRGCSSKCKVPDGQRQWAQSAPMPLPSTLVGG